jgi:hypothetical protein
MLGAVVSWMVKVNVSVEEFRQSSFAVKVTVAIPVSPQSSLRLLKSLLQVTSLQGSLAVAPPCVFNQCVSSTVLPLPSHSTVEGLPPEMMGPTLSVTVMV